MTFGVMGRYSSEERVLIDKTFFNSREHFTNTIRPV